MKDTFFIASFFLVSRAAMKRSLKKNHRFWGEGGYRRITLTILNSRNSQNLTQKLIKQKLIN